MDNIKPHSPSVNDRAIRSSKTAPAIPDSTCTSSSNLHEQLSTKINDPENSCSCVNGTYRQWIIFIILCSISFCSGLCYSLQAPFYPKVARSKGVPATVYGMIFGVFELVNFIACPIYGKNIKKLGAKRLLNVGNFVMAFSCILFGFVDKIPSQIAFVVLSFIIRIFEALGQAAYLTSAYAIVAHEFPDNVATTFSIFETAFGVGMIIGPAIGGVMYDVGGYFAPFALVGIFLLLSSVCTFFLLPVIENTSTRPSSVFKLLKILPISISYYSIATVAFSYGFIQTLLEPHIRQFNLTASLASVLFILSGGTYAFSAIGWGYAADKGVNPKLSCGVGASLIILGFAFLGPFPFIPIKQEVWLLGLSLAIAGIGAGGVYVSAFVDSSREAVSYGFPDNLETYGIISGLWVSGLALGSFLGPFISGLLYDIIGFRNVALILGVMQSVVVILSLFNQRYYSKKISKQSQTEQTVQEVKLIFKNSECNESISTL